MASQDSAHAAIGAFEAIGEMLGRRYKEAGIARIRPHDFRKTFISSFLASGKDLVLAQRQAGHADVSTTARYDRRDDLLLQQAVEDLWFPSPDELQPRNRQRPVCPVPTTASPSDDAGDRGKHMFENAPVRYKIKEHVHCPPLVWLPGAGTAGYLLAWLRTDGNDSWQAIVTWIRRVGDRPEGKLVDVDGQSVQPLESPEAYRDVPRLILGPNGLVRPWKPRSPDAWKNQER